MKFPIKNNFSKCDQIRSLLKKSLMENFIFCAVAMVNQQTFQRRFNVVFRLIWRRDVVQRQINVKTTLCMSTLKFTM